MAIKLCKVFIKCIVMFLCKIYLTIASNITLTTSLLCILHIFIIVFLIIISQCCHWKLLQHAAFGCNFLQFHGIDTLCNMKHFSSFMSSSYIPSYSHKQWSWSLTLMTLEQWMSLAPVFLYSEPMRSLHMTVIEVCYVSTLVNCSCKCCTFEVVKESILSGWEQFQ